MKILLLTHSFNCLCQRIFLEATQLGHEISVEYDINDDILLDAANLFMPDVIIAPYLKRRIPASIWQKYLCLIIHPGIVGDKGPSSLDWAILNRETIWGVTYLQANDEFDAGDIWATTTFPMRSASKGSLYRQEITNAAAKLLPTVLANIKAGGFVPRLANSYSNLGKLNPVMKQKNRKINWQLDEAIDVVRKINSGDSFPGVLDTLCSQEFYLYNAHVEYELHGNPGSIIAERHGAICIACAKGAVWVTHLRKKSNENALNTKPFLKQKAVIALHEKITNIAKAPTSYWYNPNTYQHIYYVEEHGVGYLHFPFYNGAMGIAECNLLQEAFLWAAARPVQVLALMGGVDFWSNGINLFEIEAASSAAQASLDNILAINSLVKTIITTTNKYIVSVMQGNAGSGGCFLALAADKVWAASYVMLNPHYKNMGNLYGSEYWTYLLPKRLGQNHNIMQERLPVLATTAAKMGFIDEAFGVDNSGFIAMAKVKLESIATNAELGNMLQHKQQLRNTDELVKPLQAYADAEIIKMRNNFFGFDPSYHVARYNFVFKVPHSRTPLHLAKHRKGT